MIVVGGGVVGIEYAIMFAVLGVNVTVVDGRERPAWILRSGDRRLITLSMSFLGHDVPSR